MKQFLLTLVLFFFLVVTAYATNFATTTCNYFNPIYIPKIGDASATSQFGSSTCITIISELITYTTTTPVTYVTTTDGTTTLTYIINNSWTLGEIIIAVLLLIMLLAIITKFFIIDLLFDKYVKIKTRK